MEEGQKGYKMGTRKTWGLVVDRECIAITGFRVKSQPIYHKKNMKWDEKKGRLTWLRKGGLVIAKGGGGDQRKRLCGNKHYCRKTEKGLLLVGGGWSCKKHVLTLS